MSKFYPHLLNARPFDLPGQFVLGSAEVVIPKGWRTLSHGKWTLAVDPRLPVLRVQSDVGDSLGWLLGHAITREGKLAAETISVRPKSSWDATCDDFVGELSGRFALLMLEGPEPRLYPDAYAMLAAVYAPELGMVASTTRLIPLTAATAYDVKLILASDIPYTNAMYPLGLTPRRGVERVLPSHYLDLSSWELVRRWPSGDEIALIEPAIAIRRVADWTSRNIEAIVAAHPVQCPLTAGRDSRLLLACSRAVVDQMTFFTARFPAHGLGGWRDVTISKRIAARFGLRHTVLPWRRPRANDLLEWVQRTAGETGETTGWRGLPTLKQVSREKATLIGWAGDIARPLYHIKRNPNPPVSPREILDICNVPHIPEFMTRAERWLEAMPSRDALMILDMLFIEQRGGCWAGTIEYAEDGYSLRRLPPLCNEEIVRTLFRLPEAYRQEMVFERDLIAARWPELLEFPFNEQVPVTAIKRRYFRTKYELADTAAHIGRVMRHAHNEPTWLVQKLKNRF